MSALVGWTFAPIRRWPYDPDWRRTSWRGEEWTSEVVPIPPCTRLTLAWNARTPPGAGLCFEVSLRIEGEWSPPTPMGEWGRVPDVASPEGPVRREVDVATWPGHADALYLRGRSFPDGDGRLPEVRRVVVSCTSPAPERPCPGPPKPGPMIVPVPFFSQMAAPPEIARRICGPASLAMLLAAHHPHVRTEQIAAAAFDERHNIYGNWAHLAALAGEHGFAAWIEYHRCLAEVEKRLMAGYGAILSIAFEEGQLDGAPISRTDGHLLVLRGWDARGDAVCNDPAFSDARGDGVVYRREQIERAWAEHGGATILVRPEGG